MVRFGLHGHDGEGPKSGDQPPPKGLEVSPGIMKNVHWCDLNFSRLFGCCVPPSSHLLL